MLIAELSASRVFSESLVVKEEPAAAAVTGAEGPTVEEKIEKPFESVEVWGR